jgi:hypothetical protein
VPQCPSLAKGIVPESAFRHKKLNIAHYNIAGTQAAAPGEQTILFDFAYGSGGIVAAAWTRSRSTVFCSPTGASVAARFSVGALISARTWVPRSTVLGCALPLYRHHRPHHTSQTARRAIRRQARSPSAGRLPVARLQCPCSAPLCALYAGSSRPVCANSGHSWMAWHRLRYKRWPSCETAKGCERAGTVGSCLCGVADLHGRLLVSHGHHVCV